MHHFFSLLVVFCSRANRVARTMLTQFMVHVTGHFLRWYRCRASREYPWDIGIFGNRSHRPLSSYTPWLVPLISILLPTRLHQGSLCWSAFATYMRQADFHKRVRHTCRDSTGTSKNPAVTRAFCVPESDSKTVATVSCFRMPCIVIPTLLLPPSMVRLFVCTPMELLCSACHNSIIP